MKKLATVCVLGVVFMLSACETSQIHGGEMTRESEQAAPYAPERSAGSGDEVFRTYQSK